MRLWRETDRRAGSSQEGEFGVDSSVLCAETSALVIRHGFANGCAMNIPTELMQQNCPHSFTSLFTKHEMIPRDGRWRVPCAYFVKGYDARPLRQVAWPSWRNG